MTTAYQSGSNPVALRDFLPVGHTLTLLSLGGLAGGPQLTISAETRPLLYVEEGRRKSFVLEEKKTCAAEC